MALAVVWGAALLALVPGAATSSGFVMVACLVVMAVAALTILVALAVQNLRSPGVARSEGPAAPPSGD